jgi:hypothetical protein
LTPLRWTPALLAAGLAILSTTASAEYAPGKASLGGSLGVPFLYATQEMRAGQRPRVMGKAHFQYVFTPSMRLSLRGGFGWTDYSADELAPYPLPSDNTTQSSAVYDTTRVDQITTLMPFTATLVHTSGLGGSANWKWFAGGGLGVYHVNVMNDRRTIKDPVTLKSLSYLSPGANAELGVEYFLPANKNVSLEWLGTGHILFPTHAGDYPSGYSGRHGFVDLSFGVNIYFNAGGASVASEPTAPKEPAKKPEGEAPAPATVPQPQTPPPTPSPYPNP